MGIHPWWAGFGQAVTSPDDLTLPAGARVGIRRRRRHRSGRHAHGLERVRDDRARGRRVLRSRSSGPKTSRYPIRATEPVAVVFAAEGGQPRVLALRDDFPDTPHQNWTPQDAPCSLCIDDRPWPEAKLTYRPADLIRRIQLWLAKAARGELHDTAQPPDPLFFVSQLAIIIPRSALQAGRELLPN